ncbi:hypothetical protein N7476_001544 [Penicillium atrosanguineum]|uniref:BTB domain-containing protein n=1 Tax=Penicillium atrosanguineum TaxID=1132637 RepID=A0A9W9UCQ4_9EURO|nr:hypothetical protein N7476_001544 [Penicillium atrosanguineum]
MNSDYPPLTRPGAEPIPPAAEGTQNSPEEIEPNEKKKKKLPYLSKDSKRGSRNSSSNLTVICPDGDMIIEYVESSSTGNRYWQLSSQDLMHNSPYFQALLDPNKFAEGRLVAEYKQRKAPNGADLTSSVNTHGNFDALGFDLPIVKISETRLTKLCGAGAIELFLKILCAEGLGKDKQVIFDSELKVMPPSIVVRTIEIAESFSSPNIVKQTLRRAWYMFGKTKISWNKFGSPLLKQTEERVRQIIVIAEFIGDYSIAKVMMHTLLVMGSKYWDGRPEPPATDHLRWQYLPGGVEEELYYRRQCVMNTITDLQAHFLRVYGGLEEIPKTNDLMAASTRPTLGTTFSTSIPHSEYLRYQCRAGFGNGSQCDLFHLGQMTRFFALKSKSIFLGSTLIDPDFSMVEDDDDKQNGNPQTPAYATPPSAIISLFASLKQYPDYQIDTTHHGCGVRRRILPVLNGIEKYILDPRGLLGIDYKEWKDSSKRPQIEWSSKTSRKGHTVDIRFEKIVGIHMSSPKFSFVTATTSEDEARLLFTAKKRNWESYEGLMRPGT